MEEKEFYSKLGENISLHRERNSITQLEMSKVLKLSRVSIVNIEKGRQKVSVFQLKIISEYLDVELSEFLPVISNEVDIEDKAIIRGKNLDNKTIEELFNFINLTKGGK